MFKQQVKQQHFKHKHLKMQLFEDAITVGENKSLVKT